MENNNTFVNFRSSFLARREYVPKWDGGLDSSAPGDATYGVSSGVGVALTFGVGTEGVVGGAAAGGVPIIPLSRP